MASRMVPARLLPLSHVPLLKFSPKSLLLLGSHGRSLTREAGLLHNVMEVSSNRNILERFRTFCTGKDLSEKKCVPCNSKDLRPMAEEAAKNLMPKVPEWDLVSEGGILKLQQSWKVKSFIKGLQFFDEVGRLAESEGHHPDLHLVRWNNVKIEIWTHAVGGLTENDFILAAKINGLNMHHLMARKGTSDM